MKKVLLAFILFLAVSSATNAQGVLDKAKSVAGASGFDVSKLSEGIMGKLTSSLSLTGEQKPKVGSMITDFLTKKSQIIPLQTSDNAAYTSKASSLTSNLLGKLKGVLTAVQYAKLLGLKPKAPDAANVLSQLFF